MPWPDVGMDVKAKDPWADIPIDDGFIERNKDWWLSYWLPTIAKRRMALLQSRIWIQDDKDGFTGWRRDKYNSTTWIVCAANKFHDIVVPAPRHASVDMHQAYCSFGGWSMLLEYAKRNGSFEEQGFIDQFSIFYTREEAFEIAEKNGQIRFPEGNSGRKLFSEGLY